MFQQVEPKLYQMVMNDQLSGNVYKEKYQFS